MVTIRYTSTNSPASGRNYTSYDFKLKTSDTVTYEKMVVKSVKLSFSSFVTNGAVDPKLRLTVGEKSVTLALPQVSRLEINDEQLNDLFSGVLSSGNTFTLGTAVIMDSYKTLPIREKCVVTLQISIQESFSPSTINVSNTDFGSFASIRFQNEDLDEVNHTVRLTMKQDPTKTASYTLRQGDVTQDLPMYIVQVPISWISAIPTSATATINVTVTTYKVLDNVNTQVGSVTGSFTATVPSRYAPSASQKGIRWINNNSVIKSWNIAVQNNTGVEVTFTQSPSDEYTSMKYIRTATCDGGTVTNTGEGSFTVTQLTKSGTINYTYTITDGRGRSSTVQGQFYVYPYANPSITYTSTIRCDKDGIANDKGAYAKVAIDGTVSSCGNRNSMRLSIGYSTRSNSDNPVIVKSDAAGRTEYIIGGSFEQDLTYYIYFIATDGIGKTARKVAQLETVMFALHIKKGGNGIAFGKTSQRDNAIEINKDWSMYFGDVEFKLPIGVSAGGTGGNTVYTANKGVTYIGVEPISSTADDNVAKWIELGSNTIARYNHRILTGQPSTYGLVQTISDGIDSVIQIWYCSPDLWQGEGSQDTYMRRGTRSTPFSKAWRQIFTTRTIIPISNGGTGAWTAAGARANLGLTAGSIQNLSDTDYPESTNVSEMPKGISAIPTTSTESGYPAIESTIVNLNVDDVGRNMQFMFNRQGLAAYRGQHVGGMNPWNSLLTSRNGSRIEAGSAQITSSDATRINFTQTYKAAPFVIASFSQYDDSGVTTNPGVVKCFSIQNTGFSARVAGTSSTTKRNIMWIAIGE